MGTYEHTTDTKTPQNLPQETELCQRILSTDSANRDPSLLHGSEDFPRCSPKTIGFLNRFLEIDPRSSGLRVRGSESKCPQQERFVCAVRTGQGTPDEIRFDGARSARSP